MAQPGKSKGYSAINIGGLAVGMAVAILIGLWIWDELSFNKYFKNYDRIAQVMQHQNFNGEIATQTANPAVMAEAIRSKFGSDFKYVVQASWNFGHTLAYGEKKLGKARHFFEPEATELFSLNMLKGTRAGLKEPYSILLSETMAKAIFGNADPLNKVLRMDNKVDVKVTGVYEDFPHSTTFRDIAYMMPWSLYLIQNKWISRNGRPLGQQLHADVCAACRQC
jgi:putative ABC transport system permease protein